MESKMGLMFNAVLKIPMQFFILLTGVMLYVFYIFYQSPVHYNEISIQNISGQGAKLEVTEIEQKHELLAQKRKDQALAYRDALGQEPMAIEKASKRLKKTTQKLEANREDMRKLITEIDSSIKTKDSDYVFLTFILNYLPAGLVGLLIAVIFSAAMSSTSGELNALATTTAIDFYRNLISPNGTDKELVFVSKFLTAFWGFIAICFAFMAHRSENLIEMVNILGSIFYGNILGIFLVAFFVKHVEGNAVFWGAIISQSIVIVAFFFTTIGYLWFNVIGCIGVMFFSIALQPLMKKTVER